MKPERWLPPVSGLRHHRASAAARPASNGDTAAERNGAPGPWRRIPRGTSIWTAVVVTNVGRGHRAFSSTSRSRGYAVVRGSRLGRRRVGSVLPLEIKHDCDAFRCRSGSSGPMRLPSRNPCTSRSRISVWSRSTWSMPGATRIFCRPRFAHSPSPGSRQSWVGLAEPDDGSSQTRAGFAGLPSPTSRPTSAARSASGSTPPRGNTVTRGGCAIRLNA